MKYPAKRGVNILSGLGVIMAFLPLIRTTKWWIRIFDFPKTQVASICFAALLLSIKHKQYRTRTGQATIAALIAAIIYELSFISRYTPLHPIQAKRIKNPDDKNRFTLLQANIRMKNHNTDGFIKLVKEANPDIVTINEPDNWWADHLQELDEMYPYAIKHPLDNTYGMMLFSKLPIKKQEINYLVENDIPSILATIELPSGCEFDIHCLHPRPPQPHSDTWERDAELLIVGKRITDEKRPAIIAGDLNDVAWSHTSRRFQELYNLLDPRVGRGLYNTYNVNTPMFRYPLDHFFYTQHFWLCSLKKLKNFGSDHFPVMIDLVVKENDPEGIIAIEDSKRKQAEES